MKNKGFLLDPETGDPQIKVIRDNKGLITGGLAVGDVTQQNQALIISLNAGEIKTAPTVGVGIDGLLLDHEVLMYKHKIREQLTADGQNISYLSIKVIGEHKTEIKLNANY